jgi:hypothetical protein
LSRFSYQEEEADLKILTPSTGVPSTFNVPDTGEAKCLMDGGVHPINIKSKK